MEGPKLLPSEQKVIDNFDVEMLRKDIVSKKDNDKIRS